MAVNEMLGAIIAAGEGSRLRRDGLTLPKPLVQVAGMPLIDSVIRNFDAADIGSLVIIVNEQARECVRWVRERFPRRPVEFIVKTTASSLESFLEVIHSPGAGRMLVSTVDAWCAPADFARFAQAAAGRPPDATVLGVTPFVADEKPLWADIDPSGRVSALGGPRGSLVTAGLYLVPECVRRLAPPSGLARLRDLLTWLHGQGHPIYGELIPEVVDVDRAEDIALAEAVERSRQRQAAEEVSR